MSHGMISLSSSAKTELCRDGLKPVPARSGRRNHALDHHREIGKRRDWRRAQDWIKLELKPRCAAGLQGSSGE